MQIAVGIYCQGLFITKLEFHIGGFAGVQPSSLAALVGDQLYPLDPVSIYHRVIHGAYIDFHNAVLHSDGGDVLFTTGLYGVGDQFLHLLAAAEGLHAGIMNHLDDITAVGADIKLGVLHIGYLRNIIFMFYCVDSIIGEVSFL